MNKMTKQIVFSLIVGIISSTGAWAATDLPTSLVRMKTGALEFTVYQADGVKPASDVSIEIFPSDAARAAAISGALSDAKGLAKVSVVEDGRYILSVNDTPVALLQTSAEETRSAYRLLLPASGLLVGGQEADDIAGVAKSNPEAKGENEEETEEESDEETEEESEEEFEEEEEDRQAEKHMLTKNAGTVIAAAVIAGAIILIADDDDNNNTPASDRDRRVLEQFPTAGADTLGRLRDLSDSDFERYLSSSKAQRNVALERIRNGQAPFAASSPTLTPTPARTTTPRTVVTLPAARPATPPPPAPSSP